MGGNLSFGDNDTLAKMVDTLSEEFARRTTEAIAYQFFNCFRYTEDRAQDPPLLSLTPGNRVANGKNLDLTDGQQDAVLDLLRAHRYLSGWLTKGAK